MVPDLLTQLIPTAPFGVCFAQFVEGKFDRTTFSLPAKAPTTICKSCRTVLGSDFPSTFLGDEILGVWLKRTAIHGDVIHEREP